MIKILIADDHVMFADGIESIINTEPDMEVVGKTPTGTGIFEIIQQKEVNLILLDINLLDMNGIEVAKKLKAEQYTIQFMAISMFNEESYISEILQQGASGYILKNTNKTQLLKAIRAVHQGKTFFSPEVTETIMRGLSQNKNDKKAKASPKLSRREKEVLDLIAKEFTTKEIASELFVSLKTVESHRSSLLAKFEVRNSVGLIKIAVEKGLV